MATKAFRIESAIHLGEDVPLVFAFAMAICLLGIFTRPLGFLAEFWPANALMLAVFVRFPRLSRATTWMAAFAGFVAADLLTANSIAKTFSLTAANFAGIAASYAFLRSMTSDTQKLVNGLAVVYFFCAAVVGAFATAAVGAYVSMTFNSAGYIDAFGLWFSSELTNYVTIAPIVLTIPEDLRAHLRAVVRSLNLSTWTQRCHQRLFSVVLLCVLSYGSHWLGGPGAFVYPLPALLLVALMFSLSTTTVIIFLYAVWCYAALLHNLVDTEIVFDDPHDTMSIRLGITMLALGPLAVASMNRAREALVVALDFAATRDGLTGLLNRQAFITRASTKLRRTSSTDMLVMMLDIDHFKAINDSYGHAAGDLALVRLTEQLRAQLRTDDVFGRLGGEEFGILVNTSRDGAQVLINRLLSEIRATKITLDDGQVISPTISIGGIVTRGNIALDDLLSRADRALYEAKRSGRDRAVVNDQDE